MKVFWTLVGRYAVKLALYALAHPDEVTAVAQTIHAAKESK